MRGRSRYRRRERQPARNGGEGVVAADVEFGRGADVGQPDAVAYRAQFVLDSGVFLGTLPTVVFAQACARGHVGGVQRGASNHRGFRHRLPS